MAGHPNAMWRLVQLLDTLGRDDVALIWLQRHAETGAPLAVLILSLRLCRRGREQEAETLLRSHAQAGQPGAM
jgi:hypothetical protein